MLVAHRESLMTAALSDADIGPVVIAASAPPGVARMRNRRSTD